MQVEMIAILRVLQEYGVERLPQLAVKSLLNRNFCSSLLFRLLCWTSTRRGRAGRKAVAIFELQDLAAMETTAGSHRHFTTCPAEPRLKANVPIVSLESVSRTVSIIVRAETAPT